MKTPLIASIACAMIISTGFAADVSSTTTTTTTRSSGTLSEYAPGTSFVIKETTGPIKYRYGKKVTYVTRSGKVLSDDEVRTRIKVGSPVSVQFSTEGEDRIIDRVEIDD